MAEEMKRKKERWGLSGPAAQDIPPSLLASEPSGAAGPLPRHPSRPASQGHSKVRATQTQDGSVAQPAPCGFCRLSFWIHFPL